MANSETDKEIEDELQKLFWPHSFDDGSKPLQIITTGDTEKLFVNSYSIVIGKLHSLITQARVDELEKLTLENFDTEKDYRQWSKSVLAYIKNHLSELQAKQKGGE